MKVLLVTDGSEVANEAVAFVRVLAEKSTIDAFALTVSYDPAHYSLQPWVTQWNEQEGKQAEEILDRVKTTLQDACRSVTVAHRVGATVPCILEHAALTEADLIVVGATGHSAIRRVLLGSVSDSVATNAKCSVLVVRPSKRKAGAALKVVLGFDQSIASREAVTELMQWNLPASSEVDVVSVALQPQFYAGEGTMGLPVTISPEQVSRVEEAAERIASQIADHYPHTNSHVRIAEHVGDALVSAAEEGKADLVVVGDTGHGMLESLLVGSTCKFVLRHAPCSVLISRHHWNSESSPTEVADAVATK